MAFIQESEWWRGEILGVVVGFCAERKRKGSEIKAVDAKNNKIVFFLVSSLPVALGGCPRMARAKRLASAVPEGRG